MTVTTELYLCFAIGDSTEYICFRNGKCSMTTKVSVVTATRDLSSLCKLHKWLDTTSVSTTDSPNISSNFACSLAFGGMLR